MAVIAVENKFEYRAFISQPRENNFEKPILYIRNSYFVFVSSTIYASVDIRVLISPNA